jgi:hypothetical protein
MKGSNVSAKEKRFHDALVRIVGCIACRKMGRPYNGQVSIHHLAGRTKPGAHWQVLGLCAGHHQDGYGQPDEIAVHPWKARFEDAYGTQEDLLAECITLLRAGGFAEQCTFEGKK